MSSKDTFFKLASEEVERSRNKHGNISSIHEGLGILEEEFWEVKQEIFKNKHDKPALLKELIQVAAMCAKLAKDAKLIGN